MAAKSIAILIREKKYFVLHAPRQTGKTTCLLALADHLNQEGKYACVYTNVETAQAAHLLIFDRDPDRSWEQKLFCRQESHNDHPITVWGM